MEVEEVDDFCKSLGKKVLNASKKIAKFFYNNHRTASEIGANGSTAFKSRNPKAALSTLSELISCHHAGSGVRHGNFA